MRSFRLLAVVPALLLTGACADSTAPVTPDSPLSVSRGAVTPSKPASGQTIVDVAIGAPQFSTLVSLVVAAGLVDELAARGQRTVFAPTNAAFDAFAAANPAIFAALQDPANVGLLREVLLYHIAPGNLDAAEVVAKSRLRMANGQFTSIAGATINGNAISITDIAASNGVIHAIDGVLVPAF